MGRTGDACRSKFDVMKDFMGKKVAVCMYCKQHISPVALRLRNHLSRCHSNPERPAPSFKFSTNRDQVYCSSSPFYKHLSTQIIGLVGRMLISMNTSFCAIDNKYLLDLMAVVSPSVKVPCSRTFGTTILNQVYTDCQKQLIKMLSGQVVTLTLDGWSNPMNVGLIGVAINEHFVGLIERRLERHTADTLQEVASQSVKDVEATYHCKVGAVCTDGAANVALARKRLGQCAHLLEYHCQAHLLNLVMADLMKDAGRDRVIKMCSTVLNKFRSVQVCPLQQRFYSPNLPLFRC